jgi:colicin import membrane protein
VIFPLGEPMMSLALVLLLAVAPKAGPKASTTDRSDFDEYISQLKNRVELAWSYPKAAEHLHATVKFNLNSLGQVSAIKITQSSGRTDFDSSVVDAIKKSSPFPRLPKRLVTESPVREVEMTFKGNPEKPDSTDANR